MKLKERFLKFITSFENALFANHSCNSCGREIVDGTEFQMCELCRNKVERLDGDVCAKCGDKLAVGMMICDHCKDFDYVFKENRSFAYYENSIANIVKGLKFGHKKYLAKDIAEMMLTLGSYFDDVDVIAFVPISKERERERGFNQAEAIAEELGKLLEIEVVDALEKVSNGKHQAELSQQERMKNLIGSFAEKENMKDKIKGKVVLIVDDVFTTGATLNECSKTIKNLKPKSVKTVTFAKTKFNLSK